MVRLWCLFDVGVNTFAWWHHFRVNIPFTDFAEFAAELVDTYNAACNAILFENMSSYVFGRELRVEVADPPSDDVFHGAHSPLNQGLDEFICGPLTVAATIRWRTVGSEPKSWGTTNLTGLRPNSWAFGGLTSAAHEWAQLYAQAMLDTFGPVGTYNRATLVIVSWQTGGEPREIPLARVVSSWDLRPNQSTWRRRAGEFDPGA